MKIYLDAGLNQIAEAIGFRGETLTSLEHCSNFTNTSRFLFYIWEALFLYMQATWLSSFQTPEHTHSKELLDNLMMFLEHKSVKDDNWKFWSDFVLKTCLSLYLSVQSSYWTSPVASMKSMVAVFAAYDRPNYHKFIPQHIADILQMPLDTVSITGQAFHNVAFDESHQILINKDIKRAIVRPSCEHCSQMSSFYQQKAARLIHQVLPTKEPYRKEPTIQRQEGARKCRQHGGSNKARCYYPQQQDHQHCKTHSMEK